jgi:hypothetical protein
VGNLRVNLYLDEEYHAVIVDEIGRQHVSEFFRLIEEEFFNCPEFEGLSIRLRAREIAARARTKILQQRKLIQDQESFKEREAREARERIVLIEETVIAEVRRHSFKEVNLPDYDDQLFTSEGLRSKLLNEISHKCQLDLQWKDVDLIVRKAVRV